VVTYSTMATVDVNYLDPSSDTDHVTKCSVYSRLRDTVERAGLEGHTATGNALRTALRVLADSRPGARKAVILITDGRLE
jgi:Mg-chelatase subunit ChlD